MKKGTKRLLTLGAIIAFGACGDTVEVEVPPPEIPDITFPPPVIPPVPPPTPTPNQPPAPQGTIPAQTIVVGGTATQNVAGFFTDPEGDALTYSASSSNEAVATVAMDNTVATITAVAVGNAVVTVTAMDDQGRAAAQAFGVTVEEEDEGVRPATVTIFGLRDPSDRNVSVDPSSVSGAVSVLLDVQYNDETVTAIDLMLGDSVISCRGTSSDANETIAGLAESGGAVEVDCYLNTAAVMGACMGEQLMPAYANGGYALGARITTDDGTTRESLATQQVTLKNGGHVVVAHDEGNSVIKGGAKMFGGPVADDGGNQNTFHVCPVSYAGTTVGKVSLRALSTGADKADPHQMETSLSFKAPTRTAAFNGVAQDSESPFSWNVNPAWNDDVEDEGPGMREHWVFAAEKIENSDGLDVSSEFADENPYGPYYFDFVAPDATEISVGPRATLTLPITGGVHLSSGNFYVDADDREGVGVGEHSISVGDCAANSPYGPGEGPASVASQRVDRTKVDFDALYEDVATVGALAEEDAARGDDDGNEADCYVAELASLTDKLGNEWSGGKSPSSWLQTANFGVDKTAPVLEDFEPDAFDEPTAGVSVGNPLALPPEPVQDNVVVIEFEVQNPELESGDAGSPLVPAGTATVPNPVPRQDPISVGTVVKADITDPNDDDWVVNLNELGKDGAKSVTITVSDGAFPANKSTWTVDLIYDTTQPTFSGSGPGGAHIASGTTFDADVSGVIADMSEIEDAWLTVRNNDPAAGGATVSFCEMADPVLSRTRVPSNGARGTGVNVANGTNSIDLDRTLTVNRPTATGTDQLCVLLQTEDAAGNAKDFSLGTFSVQWPFGMTISEEELTIAEGTEGSPNTGTFTVVLSAQPAGPVTVSISQPSSGSSLSVDMSSITFHAVDDGTGLTLWNQAQTVTVSAAQDDNAVNEEATLSITASGGGYDGVRGSVAVEATDPDVTFEPTTVSIDEGATDTVMVTVTRATAGDAALTIAFAEGEDADGAITSVGSGQADALEIPAGETSATLAIEIVATDGLTGTDDSTATITVTPTGGRGLPVAGITVTIVNDDEA